MAVVDFGTANWLNGSALLLLGNKIFGLSSGLRHIRAACFPANIPLFNYNWKKKVGIYFLLLVFLFAYSLHGIGLLNISSKLMGELNGYGIFDYSHIVPVEVVNWNSGVTLKI